MAAALVVYIKADPSESLHYLPPGEGLAQILTSTSFTSEPGRVIKAFTFSSPSK